jgi:hypothetical protein
MMDRDNFRQAASRVLQTDDVEQILSNNFFSGVHRCADKAASQDARPDHYKVICISLYNEDLKQLDGMVAKLKRRGLTKASRSALIRFALSQVNLDDVPRGL